MGLLDDKREADGFGNPEFFYLNAFKNKIRFRRDSIQRYQCDFNEKDKEWRIKMFLNYGKASSGEASNVYTYTIPETMEKQKDRILEQLDKLFNTKVI